MLQHFAKCAWRGIPAAMLFNQCRCPWSWERTFSGFGPIPSMCSGSSLCVGVFAYVFFLHARALCYLMLGNWLRKSAAPAKIAFTPFHLSAE
jgi:hypothetical protein